MPRRKKPIEGLVMELDDLVNGTVDVDALIAAAEEKECDAKKKLCSIIEKESETDEEILIGIPSFSHCDECKRELYMKSPLWRGRILCHSCHRTAKQSLSADLSACIEEAYNRGCAFCDVKSGRFHLDHVNMFSKEKSVCEMIDEGDSEEDIKNEIAKCQLLCVDCHILVTKYEHRRGFMKEKKYLNRQIAAGKDVTELRRTLYEKYDAVMGKIYPLIRARVRGGGGRVGGFGVGAGGVS